ncbi:hypothetical protein CFIO01_09765 [Colletotrichum fioriniae PJ7]|uniref:Uncharacterized protein n=1 Tax=Colletotrichum fioriniae PJ7 TaxID=1445577 RepID=A0A010QJB4_9PEZI|nr:hypothetical protein CFIO01_09765 [Colletotrichum fioriniae PJ7]
MRPEHSRQYSVPHAAPGGGFWGGEAGSEHSRACWCIFAASTSHRALHRPAAPSRQQNNLKFQVTMEVPTPVGPVGTYLLHFTILFAHSLDSPNL